jgi:peroxiredoxin
MEATGRTRKFILVLLVSIAALLIFEGGARAELKYLDVKVGDEAPDFILRDLDGETIILSAFEGEKVVMIDFWATWCNVCKKEMPTINENYIKYKDKGYVVLSVVLNASDERGVRKIQSEKNLQFPILLDTGWKVSKLYGLQGPIPVKIVIDVNGVIRFTHYGEFPHGENEIPYVIEELITEIPPQAIQAPEASPEPEASDEPAETSKAADKTQ